VEAYLVLKKLVKLTQRLGNALPSSGMEPAKRTQRSLARGPDRPVVGHNPHWRMEKSRKDNIFIPRQRNKLQETKKEKEKKSFRGVTSLRYERGGERGGALRRALHAEIWGAIVVAAAASGFESHRLVWCLEPQAKKL
jgi:hypothetical protein